MLKSLTISNYALIENLEIDFPEGLIIITGETGAGKSILLGALSLLLGSKADPGALKDPGKNCVVEALFETEGTKNINGLFSSEGLEFSKDITLRRVITPAGKSRNFVNDEPVTLQFLKALSEKIIDIHAQHQHLLLSDSKFQLSVLDSFAGNGELSEEYTQVYEELSELNSRLKSLKERIAKEEADNDYNTFQYTQLEEAKLVPGELAELEEEFRMLSNAEEIKSSLLSMTSLLTSEEFSIVRNLKELEHTANRISSNFPSVIDISKRAENCRIELKDMEEELSLLADKVIVSPERTQIAEERLSLLYNLLKKHHAESIEELITIKETIAETLRGAETHREELDILTGKVTELEKSRASIGEKLHKSRIDNSLPFARVMQDSVRELEMPHAAFAVAVNEENSWGPDGNSRVQFHFSANKNIEPRELSKVASGGELSRIMLCLKAVMAKGTGMPTMIFDEIDTGVSGKIADKMGQLIGEMAEGMQIFAITHLPQIASKGGCHLLVYKDMEGANGARTAIKRINGEERLMEIARMLSGSRMTDAAIANARELLNN